MSSDDGRMPLLDDDSRVNNDRFRVDMVENALASSFERSDRRRAELHNFMVERLGFDDSYGT
jgi:hypothetical protein